jgi:hypothetical protein
MKYVIGRLVIEEGTSKSKKTKDKEAALALGLEFTEMFGPGHMRTEDKGINYFCKLCNTEPQNGYFRAPVSDEIAEGLQILLDNKVKTIKGIIIKVEHHGQDMVPSVVLVDGELVDGYVEELFDVGTKTTLEDGTKVTDYLTRMA